MTGWHRKGRYPEAVITVITVIMVCESVWGGGREGRWGCAGEAQRRRDLMALKEARGEGKKAEQTARTEIREETRTEQRKEEKEEKGERKRAVTAVTAVTAVLCIIRPPCERRVGAWPGPGLT
jgi:hypothetical protein